MTILCVVFDAVGTLIHPKRPVAQTYAGVGYDHGSKLTEAQIEKSFSQAYGAATKSRETLQTNETTEYKFWHEVVSAVFHDVPTAKRKDILIELWSHFGTAAAWNIFDDVLATLHHLRQEKVTIAVGSNLDRRLHTVCDGLGISNLADRTFDSASVGYNKPSPHFFQYVQSELGYQPQQLVMVGDDLHVDVDGAIGSRWNAIWVNRHHAGSDAGVTASTRRANVVEVNTLQNLHESLAMIATD